MTNKGVKQMIKRIKDALRGYSDADAKNIKSKLSVKQKPGAWVTFTRGEYNAWRALYD